jgi:hypothetical protein
MEYVQKSIPTIIQTNPKRVSVLFVCQRTKNTIATKSKINVVKIGMVNTPKQPHSFSPPIQFARLKQKKAENKIIAMILHCFLNVPDKRQIPNAISTQIIRTFIFLDPKSRKSSTGVLANW